MPCYEHKCESCEHIWEDLFKISDPVPAECPNCGASNIKRLMSWSSGKVELTGKELTDTLKAQGKKIAASAMKNENVLANLVGESKYNDNLKRR
jgi:putative FmdB family regulatory protein